jgi:hypothetical protein
MPTFFIKSELKACFHEKYTAFVFQGYKSYKIVRNVTQCCAHAMNKLLMQISHQKDL